MAERRLETVVVAVPLTEGHLARLRERFPDVRFVVADERPAPDELRDADAVVAWRLDAEQAAGAPRLRWWQTGGAGVERMPLRELAARDVTITNNSGVAAPNIAEHLLAMMLAFARGVPALVRAQAERRWKDEAARDRVFELGGQTLLLVGLGEIGLATAARAKPFGMRVVGARRTEGDPPPGIDEVVPMARLDEALGRADHVAISLPLTERTRGLFDAGRFAAIKPGAHLYNVGRGGTVETAALVAALESGRLAGAGLDVTDPEPLPADSPLWGMPNVLITAHTSGATPRYWDRGVEVLEENIRRYLAGEELLNAVDAGEGY
ncbi:MAG: D-2-hydroxyacid dehydrogenase [Chloroflexota bacterium]|nr:D-2-hydroxyacid dehydrogenase [Chloroflexota bacterium]